MYDMAMEFLTPPRCVLLQVIDPHLTHLDPRLAEKNLEELKQLVLTYGGEIVETASQHRTDPHPSTFIGGGKVEWLKQVVKEKQIDVVILNKAAKPGQIFRLEKLLWEVNPKIKVWDRIDLILNIFDQHANTIEAKLQIQLARVQHIGPRIYGLGGTVLSRQGGGLGAKGSGETNAEFERRKIKLEKQKIQKQLDALQQNQLRQIAQRDNQHARTAALVGYTSAGKTTLFNALTGKDRQTNQALFTTLDSVVGKIKMTDQSKDILISDTIGFIEDLPPQLIQAFKTTLTVSLHAHLLLHVIDARDPFLMSKFETVEKILTDLGVTTAPLLVFNKSDLISDDQKNQLERQFIERERIFVSAKSGENIEQLKIRLLDPVTQQTA